ncbi:hypothetical protein BDAP_000912 [Binucleata daphniae]
MTLKKSFKYRCYIYLLISYAIIFIYLECESYTYKYPKYLDNIKKEIEDERSMKLVLLFSILKKDKEEEMFKDKFNNKNSLFIDQVATLILEKNKEFAVNCFKKTNTRFHLYLTIKYLFLYRVINEISLNDKDLFDYHTIEYRLMEHYNIPRNKRENMESNRQYLLQKFYSIFVRENYIVKKQSPETFFEKLKGLFGQKKKVPVNIIILKDLKTTDDNDATDDKNNDPKLIEIVNKKSDDSKDSTPLK